MVAGILLTAAIHVHQQTPSQLDGTPKREWIWQHAFPSTHLSLDPRQAVTRHHLSPSTVQKAVRCASRLAEIEKRVTCHTLRHSVAIHLLESG